jgi:hypothetical protein
MGKGNGKETEAQIETTRETGNLVLGVSELICELLEQYARDSGEELKVVRVS